jgi:hypothetical protein
MCDRLILANPVISQNSEGRVGTFFPAAQIPGVETTVDQHMTNQTSKFAHKDFPIWLEQAAR